MPRAGAEGGDQMDQLQWGRSLRSCGNVGDTPLTEAIYELQWGRSLRSCGNEWRRSGHPVQSMGFNGAAALGAAEMRRSHVSLRFETRSFNGAAALGAAEIRYRRTDSSVRQGFNGAAALGAAEICAAAHARAASGVLQWGRSLRSCGNLSVLSTRCVRGAPLQWGRSLRSCGNATESCFCHLNMLASMGPQP